MRLLVSVVSASEARGALAGGADIVDVKDPTEGALGAPSPRVLTEVVAAVGAAAPVSVALGDDPGLPHTAALAARGAELAGASYIKVGLRGVRDPAGAVGLLRCVADAVSAETAVIAAAYADGGVLDPPALDPSALPELVARTGIAGALVDTFFKDGRGLYGSMTEPALADLVARTRAAAIPMRHNFCRCRVIRHLCWRQTIATCGAILPSIRPARRFRTRTMRPTLKIRRA